MPSLIACTITFLILKKHFFSCEAQLNTRTCPSVCPSVCLSVRGQNWISQLMTTYDNLWQLMKTYDNLWQLMTTYDNLRQLMTAYDSLWQLMTTYDNLWQLMTTFDNFWQLLTTFDDFWQRLTRFDNFWQPHSNMPATLCTVAILTAAAVMLMSHHILSEYIRLLPTSLRVSFQPYRWLPTISADSQSDPVMLKHYAG